MRDISQAGNRGLDLNIMCRQPALYVPGDRTGPEVDTPRQALPGGYMLNHKRGRNRCLLPETMKNKPDPLNLNLVSREKLSST